MERRTRKERRSVGIACCRINAGTSEILMIHKRYTYAYNMFIHGMYCAQDSRKMIELFSDMTVDEKIDILSLNFSQIWYRVWLNSPHRLSCYFIAKNKFENAFVADGGMRLRNLINKSSNDTKLIWEIPKGRKKNRYESDVHCAVREFQEETGIHKDKYNLFDAKRTYSFSDNNVDYVNTYYFALGNSIVPRINFGLQDQIDEINDIRWMNMNELRLVDKQLADFVRPIFNDVKKNAAK